MSALRLHQPEQNVPHEEPVQPSKEASPDSTRSWLDVLEKLLPVPEQERKAIRDELASHLRERVRDLTIAGVSEHEAVRTAIAELGDAAELAKSYQNVKSGWPNWARSHAMKIAATSVVVAGLVVGGIALKGSGQSEQVAKPVQIALLDPSGKVSLLVPPEGQQVQPGEPANLVDANGTPYKVTRPSDASSSPLITYLLVKPTVVTPSSMPAPAEGSPTLIAALAEHDKELDNIKVSCEHDTTWGTLFENIANAAKKQNVGHTMLLAESLSIQLGDPVGVEFKDISLRDALRIMNESKASQDGPRLMVRIKGDTIEFATDEYVDKRDQETRTYSLDALVSECLSKSTPHGSDSPDMNRLEAEDKVFEDAARVVQDLVEAKMWIDNGGELASMRRYGSKMFISAPKRHFERIEWVLREIGAFQGKDGAAAPQQVQWRGNPHVLLGGTPVSKRFALKHTKAAGMRDVLSQLFNAARSLKECDVERSIEVDGSTNSVTLQSTSDQIDIVEKVVAVIDQEVPKDYGRNEEVRHVTLMNTNANGMVNCVTTILDAVPSLKECNVGRSIYPGENQNTITVVSTADQSARIISMIEQIDRIVRENKEQKGASAPSDAMPQAVVAGAR